MLFSQRQGLKPVKIPFQIDSMNDDLRNGLWNALTIYIWADNNRSSSYHNVYDRDRDKLSLTIWANFFKLALDTLSYHWHDTLNIIKKRFYAFQWFEVYDFIEFITQIDGLPQLDDFIKYCNSILEKEVSGYRFVGGKITPITSNQEITEIEEALEKSSLLSGVNTQLKSALSLMSDRKNPDYRNSIKESISAVNSLCNLSVRGTVPPR